MKLYYSTNLNPRVAVAVARYLASPVEFIHASPRDPRCEDAFRAINPNTLVPVLVRGLRSPSKTRRAVHIVDKAFTNSAQVSIDA